MDMARLRNMLVHLYRQVDHGRVCDPLQDLIEAIQAFSREIAHWLDADAKA
jgi:uncharacterized protein YutE (UPF0331/DUF86 family)